MKLLIFITKQIESINPILRRLLEEDISGATVVECEGMLKAIQNSSVDAPPIFGSLRYFINPGNESARMLMIVPRDEKRLARVREIIRENCGPLDKPNTGILFEVPVENVEGVPKEKAE